MTENAPHYSLVGGILAWLVEFSSSVAIILCNKALMSGNLNFKYPVTLTAAHFAWTAVGSVLIRNCASSDGEPGKESRELLPWFIVAGFVGISCGAIILSNASLLLNSVAFRLERSRSRRRRDCLWRRSHRASGPKPWRKPTSTNQLSVIHTKPNQPRVVVMTIWTHYPEMRWQVATLRAFVKAKSLLYLAVLNNQHDRTASQRLERMASSLEVQYTVPKPIAGGPSDLHAHALNHGLAYLRNATDFSDKDILFLLDSHMFLTSPIDLLRELDSHVWSVLQLRDKITYLWPNFSVFYLAGDESIRAASLLDDLDFRTCQGYRGVIFDSGGYTARLLDNHPEIFVRAATISCTAYPQTSSTTGGTHGATCEFLKRQRSMLPANDTHCTSVHTIERSGLDLAYQTDPLGRDCLDHGKVYHLGSGAGSNWRGCSEEWLRARRADLRDFIGGVLSGTLIGE